MATRRAEQKPGVARRNPARGIGGSIRRKWRHPDSRVPGKRLVVALRGGGMRPHGRARRPRRDGREWGTAVCTVCLASGAYAPGLGATDHARARWMSRAGAPVPLRVAWANAIYAGHAWMPRRGVEPGHRGYGYRWRAWVFLVTHDGTVLSVWPRAWWDRKAAAYAHWYAQRYGQEEGAL